MYILRQSEMFTAANVFKIAKTNQREIADHWAENIVMKEKQAENINQ